MIVQRATTNPTHRSTTAYGVQWYVIQKRCRTFLPLRRAPFTYWKGLSASSAPVDERLSSMLLPIRFYSDKARSPMPSSSLDAVLRRGAVTVRLPPPRSMTHEGLAYAACPICGAVFHMRSMLLHLTSAHKELSTEHCETACYARLQLYEREIGVPLEAVSKLSSTMMPAYKGSTSVSSSSSLPASSAPAAAATSAVAASMLEGDALQPYLPTITSSGAYRCNWCTVKRAPFSTRDAFLMHIVADHPHLDLEEVESRIPLPKARGRNDAALPRAEDSTAASPLRAVETISHCPSSVAATSTPLAPHDTTPVQAAPAAARGVGPSPAPAQRPTRRVQGVSMVEEARPAAKVAPRQSGISIPRSFSGAPAAAAVGMASPAAELSFRENHYPCEICRKVFVSELNLLHHLEKHMQWPMKGEGAVGEGTAGAASAQASSASLAITAVAQRMRKEALTSQPVQVCVTCDLCNSTKVYTLPSALFSHIRFKHPSEDAAYHVDRMIEAQRGRESFICQLCNRAFATQASLDEHLAAKHHAESRVTAPPAASFRTTTMLPPLTSKTQWWCVECERGFPSAKSLYGHLVGKHQLMTQTYPCPACKRVFNDIYSLEDHISGQHKSITLADLGLDSHASCTKCSRFFLSHEALHQHAVKHHNKDPRSPVRSFDSPLGSSADRLGSHVEKDNVASAATTASESTLGGTVEPVNKPRKVKRQKAI